MCVHFFGFAADFKADVSDVLLVLPLPHFLDELLPAQVVAAHSPVSLQLLLHDHLSGDACVVTAWVPQSGLTAHPVPGTQNNKNVLTQGILTPVGGSLTLQKHLSFEWFISKTKIL